MDKKSNNQIPKKLDLEAIKQNSIDESARKGKLQKFGTVEREIVIAKNQDVEVQKSDKKKTPQAKSQVEKNNSQSDKSAKDKEAEKHRKEKEGKRVKKEKEAQKAKQKKEKEKELKRKADVKIKKQKEKERLQKAKEKEKLENKSKQESTVAAAKKSEKTQKGAAAKLAEDVSDRFDETQDESIQKIEVAAKVAESEAIGAAASDAKEKKISAVRLREWSAKFKKLLSKFFSREFRKYSIAAIAALCVIAIIISSFFIRNHVLMKKVEYIYYGINDTAVTRVIEIDKDQQKKRVKELKRHGQKSKFDFFSRTIIEFDRWYNEGIVTLGNVTGNDCDTDGSILYRSDGIEDGKYLPSFRLCKDIGEGKFERKLYVSAYDRKTRELIGVQYIDVTLKIGG